MDILTSILGWLTASGGWSIIAIIIGIAMATSALGAIAKTLLKMTSVSDSKRRLLLNILNIVLGAIFGFFCFGFSVTVRLIIGVCAGYYSSIFYRILLKQLYNRCGINESDLNKDYNE